MSAGINIAQHDINGNNCKCDAVAILSVVWPACIYSVDILWAPVLGASLPGAWAD